MKGQQIILPPELYADAIHFAHQRGHPGQSQVSRRIRSHFWFPKMEQIITTELQPCNQCQLFTQSSQKAPLTSTPSPSLPWENVSLDLFGPLPNKSHILVARCNLTRFPDVNIVSSTASKHVLPALAETYDNFGNPHSWLLR